MFKKLEILMKFLSFLIGLLLFFASCSEREEIPTLEVGQDFTNSNVRIVSIDTFDVELSTYKFDSIITSSSNRVLIGQYTDEIFGVVKAVSYMELTPNSYAIPDDAELDSIALVLNFDGYFYSDTTKVSTINVHILNDEVRTNDDVFYNSSSISYQETPVSTVQYSPEPFDEDSLHVPIPKNIGEALFKKIQEGEINDNNELRNELKGFAIVPGSTDDSSIIGFSINNNETYLRFFYTVDDEFEDDDETFDLVINSDQTAPTYFNNIQSNTEGTFFSSLTDQEINVSSNETNGRSYIHAGVGMATRIQFPSIKKITEIPGTGTILNANLIIKPSPQAYNDLLPIRDSLSVFIADQNNIITNQLFNGTGNVLAAINENDKEFNDIYYEIPLGVYLEDELSEIPEIDNAIVVIPAGFSNTVDRTVLEGENSNDFEAKLIITYAIYDEDE